MPRGRPRTKTGKQAMKLEDYAPDKQYVWLLVKFSDSQVYKIPVEMLAELRLAKLGRERDLELKKEIMGSKSGILEIANSLEWANVMDRAFLYDGKIENLIADKHSEWRDAKKWVEEDLKVRWV